VKILGYNIETKLKNSFISKTYFLIIKLLLLSSEGGSTDLVMIKSLNNTFAVE
jgi:hypothetical protein